MNVQLRTPFFIAVLIVVFLCGYFMRPAPHAVKSRPNPKFENRASIVELIQEIQKGGYVLFVRHAFRDQSSNGTLRWALDNLRMTEEQWSDPSSPRVTHLSPDGRVQAQLIGRALHYFRIPITQVLSSPSIRCQETALLSVGRIDRLHPALVYRSMQYGEDENQSIEKGLATLINTPATNGGNTFLSSHGNALRFVGFPIRLNDLEEIDEGEMVIFKPMPGAAPEFRGKINVADWVYAMPRINVKEPMKAAPLTLEQVQAKPLAH